MKLSFARLPLLVLCLVPALLNAEEAPASFERGLRAQRLQMVRHIAAGERDSALQAAAAVRALAAPLRVSPFAPQEETLLRLWQGDWEGARQTAFVHYIYSSGLGTYYVPLPENFDPCKPGPDSLEETLRSALVRDSAEILGSLAHTTQGDSATMAIARFQYYGAIGATEAQRKIAAAYRSRRQELGTDWANVFTRQVPHNYAYKLTPWQFSLQVGGGLPLGWLGDRKANRWSRGGIVETGFVLEKGSMRYEFLGMRIGNYTLRRDMPTQNGEVWPAGAPLQIFDFTLLGPAWQPQPHLRLHALGIFGFGAVDISDRWRDSVGLSRQSNMTPAVGVALGGEWTFGVPENPSKVEYQRLALQPRVGVRWPGAEWSPARISGVETYVALHLVMRVITYRKAEQEESP